ncbi:S-adenosyl-L-methionine-dependent methyltransferase [Dichotomocladium elegans]|nr:S-adenosyl-L-methionine-dependent methyltransferase [Dichotomocladium elegans]
MSITNSPREPGHQRNDSITTCHCPRSDWPRPDRMIIRQELIRLALDGLYYSPVNLKENSRILHVGCGDGSWCIEIAKRYKDSTVIGMDLHDAIDRSNKKLPSNFKFVHAQKSFLQTLRRQPDNIFDFIFVRFLIFSCPPDMYREVIQECWRVCKPRGFVEMMELDMQIYGNPQVGPITKMLNAQVIYKMQYRALDPHFAQHLQDFFFFHELVEQMHQRHGDAYHAKYTSLPLGVWGGRIGVMFRDDWHDLIEAVHAASPEKDDHDTVAAVMRSRNKSIHPADLGALEDDDDDDDDGSLANYDPWTDQRLKATLEHVDEELETYSSFMNLHHAYAQKH